MYLHFEQVHGDLRSSQDFIKLEPLPFTVWSKATKLWEFLHVSQPLQIFFFFISSQTQHLAATLLLNTLSPCVSACVWGLCEESARSSILNISHVLEGIKAQCTSFEENIQVFSVAYKDTDIHCLLCESLYINTWISSRVGWRGECWLIRDVHGRSLVSLFTTL